MLSPFITCSIFSPLPCSYGHLSRCPPALTEIGLQLVRGNNHPLNDVITMSLFFFVQVSLNLSNNRLRHLPPDIGLFVNLQELFLQYNYLAELPVMNFHHKTLFLYDF